MRVFLIGFMGSGKSRRGRELSANLNWPLLDIDEEISRQTGRTIADIFATEGEEGFRKIESEVLRTYSYPEHIIVAVGGGLPCFHQNMDWMNANGITVYLQMAPRALISRLGNREKRPLIAHMDDDELLIFIEGKLKERTTFYEQAKLIIHGLGLTTEALRQHLNL